MKPSMSICGFIISSISTLGKWLNNILNKNMMKNVHRKSDTNTGMISNEMAFY